MHHFGARRSATIYLTGAVSGLGLFQSDPVVGRPPRPRRSQQRPGLDLQKTEGLFQFFAQAGAYSLPTLGTPYLHRRPAPPATCSAPFPVAWGKIAPSDTFSIQGGKLPTLIGAEYMFTFQNMNIERGLLWNQEPIVSRGVQANLTTGPVAWSLSLNDGFYSDQLQLGDRAPRPGRSTRPIRWPSSAAATSTAPRRRHAPATPLAQNNSTIVNLIYTYNAAPWTITPYFQYTNVPRRSRRSASGQDASTYGGAILANYAINDNVNLAGRWEYIGSSGSAAGGAPNLLGYGPGSSAMSFTLTPTWQDGIYLPARPRRRWCRRSQHDGGLRPSARPATRKTQGAVRA